MKPWARCQCSWPSCFSFFDWFSVKYWGAKKWKSNKGEWQWSSLISMGSQCYGAIVCSATEGVKDK